MSTFPETLGLGQVISRELKEEIERRYNTYVELEQVLTEKVDYIHHVGDILGHDWRSTSLEDAATNVMQRLAEWNEKAKNWTASPEAGKMLDGYRTLAAKCAELEAERDRQLETEAGMKRQLDAAWQEIAVLKGQLERTRDWFEVQAKVVSKGSKSSWDLMILRDERDAIDEVLKQVEESK
jgi:hypothetical protein